MELAAKGRISKVRNRDAVLKRSFPKFLEFYALKGRNFMVSEGCLSN
jgi:hypothetical protein